MFVTASGSTSREKGNTRNSKGRKKVDRTQERNTDIKKNRKNEINRIQKRTEGNKETNKER